jgi:regulator of nucleoside diphosphate kinase
MPSLAIKAVRPAILMAETDVERLSALALQMEPSSPLAANLLLDEIDRAQIVADREMPDDVVRMHSTVEFVDEAHGQTRTVQLVYPSEADIAARRVSVLTPVGAGLIGLRARQEIRWPDRDGHERSLKILKVVPPHG